MPGLPSSRCAMSNARVYTVEQRERSRAKMNEHNAA